jgi:hypothetical protein
VIRVTQYDAGLDRILGQDLIQDMHGRDALNCLLSVRRATYLYRSLPALAEICAGAPESRGLPEQPVPSPLAVLEMTAAEFFDPAALAELPVEYHQLARLILVLPQRYDPLDTRSLPEADTGPFAHRLFALLRVAHKEASMSFSRGRGSSMTSASVSADAQILDPYYLTRAAEAGQGFAGLVQSDLWRAFWLLRGVAVGADPEAFPAALKIAVASYLGPATDPPAAVLQQIARLAIAGPGTRCRRPARGGRGPGRRLGARGWVPGTLSRVLAATVQHRPHGAGIRSRRSAGPAV